MFLSKKNECIDCIEVSITDTGKGISKEDVGSIFLPYQTKKKDQNNVGLGLSISSKIIYDHKGMISVNSELNKGSVFKVQLPINENKNKHQSNKNHQSTEFKLDDSFFE